MSITTEKEVREMLEYAVKERRPDTAKLFIRAAMNDGIEIHKMTDLHFSLMLLLAAPKKETRGRPKDRQADLKTWFLNIACKLKSEIDNESFSYTWAAYCDRTRPKSIQFELWRCAGILLQFTKKGDERALVAVRTFELSEAELMAYDL